MTSFAINTIQGERNWRQQVSAFLANCLTSTSQSGGIPATTSSMALGADVALNNVANYFDGPSLALGSGTWLVFGFVTLTDTAGAANPVAKLWDGTTVVASGDASLYTANATEVVHLSGFFTNPAGNVRISAKDPNSVSGFIKFNVSGNSKDSVLNALRVG